MYFFFFVCSRLDVRVNKVVVLIFRFREFLPAAEGAVGRVDCDGQEVFQYADHDIKIYWSLGLGFEAGHISAEMVLAHREVEVHCVVRVRIRLKCQSAKSSGSPDVI
jgi:hypothetical protein